MQNSVSHRIACFVSLVAVLVVGRGATAQIVPDDTLEAESSVVIPDLVINGMPSERIEGGATRGAILFHSFDDFSIAEGRGAYFSNPDLVSTIFSRVTGNNPSNIFGTLGVMGGADLLFLNPNGILFGPDAQLDLRGSFTTSTASGVILQNGEIFSALDPAIPSLLTVNTDAPIGLVFEGTEPAPLVNIGNLSVEPEQSLLLVGGVTTNEGTLQAPGGQIVIATAPQDYLVQLGADAQIVGWEALSTFDNPNPIRNTITLAELLNQSELQLLSLSDEYEPGTTAISGAIDASNVEGIGGEIHILGARVGLFDASVNASGATDGGSILIGGDYKGRDPIPTANVTFIDDASDIQADSLFTGDGGRIIIWSDETSRIYGAISARGGETSGNGGFVETSSGGFLDIAISPDVHSPNVQGGTWLIDPNDISIVADGAGPTSGVDNLNPFTAIADETTIEIDDIITALTGEVNIIISTGDPTTGTRRGDINWNADLDFNGTGNNTLTLEAANNIVLIGRNTIFDSDTGNDSLSLFFDADIDRNGQGHIITNASISTGGGDISFFGNHADGDSGIVIGGPIRSIGGDINLFGTSTRNDGIFISIGSEVNSGGGDINLFGNGAFSAIRLVGSLASDGGNINLVGMSEDSGEITVLDSIASQSGDITFSADQINLNAAIAGAPSNTLITGSGNLFLRSNNPNLNLTIGGTGPESSIFLNAAELENIDDTFTSVSIGNQDSSGTISILESILNNPTTIQTPGNGGEILVDGEIITNDSALTLTADSTITLNNDISTGEGDLNISGRRIAQTSGILLIEGSASFTSSISNAGTVSVTNTASTTIGNSIIGGDFLLISPTPVNQAGILQVAGEISINGNSRDEQLINTVGLPDQRATLEDGSTIITRVGVVDLSSERFSDDLTVNSLPSGVVQFNETLEETAIELNQNNSFGGLLQFNTSIGDAIEITSTPGITQNGPISVDGAAIFNAGVGNITLTDAGNRFRFLSFTGNDVSLVEEDNIDLLDSFATGNLNLLAGETINQLDSTSLRVEGETELITQSLTGGSVTLSNESSTTLGQVLIGGDLNIASNQPITQIPGTTLNVAGERNPAESFIDFELGRLPTNSLTVIGEDVYFTAVGPTELSASILGTNSITGDLTVNSLGDTLQFIGTPLLDPAIQLNNSGNFFNGSITVTTSVPPSEIVPGTPNITQSEPLSVGGTATFNALDGEIRLENDANQFGSLAFDGDIVSIRESDATNLLDSNATGLLRLTSNGSITQNGNIRVLGESSFSSLLLDAPINLDSANQFTGSISFETVGTGNVSLRNTLSDTQLNETTLGSDLRVTSGGAITQSGTLTIAGLTRLNAGSSNIVLNQDNDFNTISVSGANNTVINDINNIDIESTRTFGDFTVNAIDDITSQNIFTSRGSIRLISEEGGVDTTDGNLTARLPSGNGGNIEIQAFERLNVGSISASGAIGGNIRLISDSELVIEEQEIISFTEGPGIGGDIELEGQSVIITDESFVSTLNLTNARGDNRGGNIIVNAPGGLVEVRNSQIGSDTLGTARSGDVIVNSSRVSIDNTRPPGLISQPRVGFSASTRPDSVGDSGNLTINATESISITGNDPSFFNPDPTNPDTRLTAVSTLTGASTATLGAGDAGVLTINAERLTIRDSAGITSAATPDSTGAGGEVKVNAAQILLQGRAGFATTTFGPGRAGDLFVNSDRLVLEDGAVISADALGDPTLEILGPAGDITIEARNILLNNRGRLSTTTRSGDGGDITLENVSLLELRRGDNTGGIFTEAGTDQSGGDGGNIFIDADFIFAIPEENTDIVANAFTGNGGSIEITTRDIRGIDFRPERTPLSDITASSEFGLDGDVGIDTSGIDLTRGFNSLPEEPRNPNVNESCQTNIARDTVEYFDIGQGGTSPGPDNVTSNNVTNNWIALDLLEIENNTSNINENLNEIGDIAYTADVLRRILEEVTIGCQQIP